MLKILIATKNPGKILEYKEILKNHRFDLITLKDLNITDEPEEDRPTFEENAIKKIRFYSSLTDLPVISEDSGLEIDYLNGEPGVLSKRWPGYEASDEELVDMILEKLKGVPWEKRGAQLKVVIALKFPGKDNILTSEGILRGILTEKPMAKIIPGYPFRALFYLPSLKKTLGTLKMEEEAKIAHRRQALRKLIPALLK